LSSGAMLSEIAFFACGAAGVASALFIFKTKDMVHAILAFAVLAVVISALMLVLGLPLLALLQLFIMIGGVSTYLFVGASSENLSKFNHTNLPLLAALSLIIALPLIYWLGPIASGNSANVLSTSALNGYISSDLQLFYLIAVLLFGVGVGSVLIIRKTVNEK
jgi:NADH-quinone oxidoreductase subunit J